MGLPKRIYRRRGHVQIRKFRVNVPDPGINSSK